LSLLEFKTFVFRRKEALAVFSGSHTVFHHRYHIVWITKYRYKVLEGTLRERIRTIIRQVCEELGVKIVSGVLSREHVHMFVEIPPKIAVCDFVRRVKGRSSHRVLRAALYLRVIASGNEKRAFSSRLLVGLNI
jgi:putative transposase